MAIRQLKIFKLLLNRESASVDKYFQEISKIPMITPEEEVELAKKIQQGDQKALAKLVSANLRFVVSVAKQHQNQGIHLLDLINEGNMGLIIAAEKFDETKGFKFISYAVWWIRQSILQAIAETSRMVRLPVNRLSILTKINKIYSKLEQEYEREPTFAEIAAHLDIPDDEVNEYLKALSQRPVSIDTPLIEGDENSNTLKEVIQGEEVFSPAYGLINESLRKEIERSLSTIGRRDAEVVRLFFGLNGERAMSLEEIGDRFDLTSERVRQIKEKAISDLKTVSRSKILKTYLG